MGAISQTRFEVELFTAQTSQDHFLTLHGFRQPLVASARACCS
jgi:hypothetical protein